MDKIAVEVQNLTIKFGDFTAVKNISFKVGSGEIFGFLGANGAGKTTTIRVLCGLIIPNSGKVLVNGLNIYDSEFAIKKSVGYMSQKFTLYNDLTVAENLNFIASLRKLDKDTYVKRRSDLLSLISFDKPMSTLVQDLSGGTKQQVSLAAAMLHDPDIIFLDEPTAGVSPYSRSLFWELIVQLANNGKTIFVTTHYMDEAEQCTRIALMRDGRIVALDTPTNLKKNTFHMPMYSFEPKHRLSFAEISELQNYPAFSYFDTYGLRFHATIKDLAQWSQDRDRFSANFNIQEINPTLEDVFIKIIEGREK